MGRIKKIKPRPEITPNFGRIEEIPESMILDANKDTVTKKVKKTDKKEYKVDIFKILNHLDRGYMDLYNHLTDEEKKNISLFMILRWLTCCSNINMNEYYCLMINEFVNKNFWQLSKEPELVLKLMAMCGCNDRVQRSYLKLNNTKEDNNKILKIFEKIFNQSLDIEELKILLKKFDSNEKILELMKDMGFQDEEIKKHMSTL